jgi:hypothetical protein
MDHTGTEIPWKDNVNWEFWQVTSPPVPRSVWGPVLLSTLRVCGGGVMDHQSLQVVNSTGFKCHDVTICWGTWSRLKKFCTQLLTLRCIFLKVFWIVIEIEKDKLSLRVLLTTSLRFNHYCLLYTSSPRTLETLSLSLSLLYLHSFPDVFCGNASKPQRSRECKYGQNLDAPPYLCTPTQRALLHAFSYTPTPLMIFDERVYWNNITRGEIFFKLAS